MSKRAKITISTNGKVCLKGNFTNLMILYTVLTKSMLEINHINKQRLEKVFKLAVAEQFNHEEIGKTISKFLKEDLKSTERNNKNE